VPWVFSSATAQGAVAVEIPFMRSFSPRILGALGLLACAPALAADSAASPSFGWTATWVGYAALAVFVVAYALVVLEERIHLRKSKPVLFGAGVIWVLIGSYALGVDGVGKDRVAAAFEHVFLEFAELFFFLVVAMSYVAAMTERNVFEALRSRLVRMGLSYRQLFWVTGVLAFNLSAWLDNLTTALIMSAVILALGKDNKRFIALAFINLVVAANAGGAWNAFGDITTLMVWQDGRVKYFEFFSLIVPSAINWLVPALCMHVAVPRGHPDRGGERVRVKIGGVHVCSLFALTIAATVASFQLLGLPTVFGMMFGLGLLKLYAFILVHRERRYADPNSTGPGFRVFDLIAKAEWDTLLFFYGVILCVGGLATIGYLELASLHLYDGVGHTWTNVIMGTASAVVDNIPIMYAVLQMHPPMDHGQWLLITLTAGVGGSMLSVGSAAGVALMGASRGMYTFFSHLRWTWAIALGYVLSILMHLWWNAGAFTNGIWR
jgi:Na+/H+ antiporter NhaD/arsenite permease-like protein